jgi:hypothetical protein
VVLVAVVQIHQLVEAELLDKEILEVPELEDLRLALAAGVEERVEQDPPAPHPLAVLVELDII